MAADRRSDIASGSASPERLGRMLATAHHLAKLGSWSWAPGGPAIWSDEMYHVLDLTPGASPVTWAELLDWVRPDDRELVVETLGRSVERHQPFSVEVGVALPSGAGVWLAVVGEFVDDDMGTRWEGICQNITDRKLVELANRQIETDLRNQERVLGCIARGEPLDHTLTMLCHTFEARHHGSRCSILAVDPVAGVLRHAAGPSLPEPYRQAIDGLPVEDGQGACGTAAATDRLVVVEDAITDPLTHRFVDLVHAYGLRAIWSTPLHDTAGAVLGTFAVYHPKVHRPSIEEVQSLEAAGSLAALAIERHRSELALMEAAQVDQLTQLPNRRRFLEHLRRSMGLPGARVAVLFLDLDRFKWINDSLGHQAGDRILAEVAARLVRVAHEGEVLARFGGDEFALLLTDATPERVDAAADRIDVALHEPFVIDGGEFFLSASIGIATDDHETDAASLVRDADAAMYVAKERGRARRATYDSGLRERAIERVTLEAELRRSIDRNEFVLHYQPMVDLRNGEWTMVEALVRWQHPQRGLLGPDAFIPLAEETGFILPLGAVILEQAVAKAAELAAIGLRITTAVNLSVVQLTDPSIAALVEGLLALHGVAPDRLVIEVTETAVMEQFDLAHATLQRLASSGVKVVIDDFGTGYSSIARLGDLPVVGVKIDRHFTAAGEGGIDGDRVFAAITNLAHAFGLQVVAEGIETQAMLRRAAAIGCDLGQGYHLARPAPTDVLVDLLRSPPPLPLMPVPEDDARRR